MVSLPPTVGGALDALGIDRSVLSDVMPRVDPDRVRLRVAPPWFLWFWAKGISAVTTPWGVFVHPSVIDRFDPAQRDRSVGLLMVHELMHVEQLERLGVIAHVREYLVDYLRGRIRRLGHWNAYRAVRLEGEARAAAALVRSRLEGLRPE